MCYDLKIMVHFILIPVFRFSTYINSTIYVSNIVRYKYTRETLFLTIPNTYFKIIFIIFLLHHLFVVFISYIGMEIYKNISKKQLIKIFTTFKSSMKSKSTLYIFNFNYFRLNK